MRTLSCAFMKHFLPLLLVVICNHLIVSDSSSILVAATRLLLRHNLPHLKIPHISPQLSYHHGPLLVNYPRSGSSADSALTVHLIWYGNFNSAQRDTIIDFFNSFVPAEAVHAASSDPILQPSVSSWWKITAYYTDALGVPVANSLKLGSAQFLDPYYSLGKRLERADLQTLVQRAAHIRNSKLLLSTDRLKEKLYVVLTAEDVYVDGFCMNACASHSMATISDNTYNLRKELSVVYAWVGNSASSCAGKCAWPFANPKDYGGPDTPPLIPPNGDVGVDGIIINIATVLAGAATNPFRSGYFQGDATAPLEAATACVGMFGKGAYPGYPGRLLLDPSTNASFNVLGINGRRFLLPALWNPSTKSCSLPDSRHPHDHNHVEFL